MPNSGKLTIEFKVEVIELATIVREPLASLRVLMLT